MSLHRTHDDVQGPFGGPTSDDDEPTQAVPAVEASASPRTGIFDDEQAPTSSAFFGSDAIR